MAAVIGNALEWYDFILYALFAPVIAATFFPAHTPIGSLLLAVTTLGVGFVVRPIGAVMLGQFADRAGRRAALMLIVGLMTAATGIVAVTPGYARIGIAAPLLIVLSRVLQGFSVGGEFGSATALLIESAPAGQVGFYGSLQGATQSVAAFGTVAAGFALTRWLGPAEVAAWGWRLPFAAGLLIGPVGLALRAGMHEAASDARVAAPLAVLWARHRAALVRVVGLVAMGTICTYVLMLTLPVYAQAVLGIARPATLVAAMAANAAGAGAALGFGALSDRVGARAVMLPGTIALGLLAYPAFVVLDRWPVVGVLLAVQVGMLTLLGTLTGPVYALVAGMFPVAVRGTGLAVGYNVGVLLFGGFAPAITTWLIAATGDRRMPGVYVAAGAVVTVAALWRAAGADPNSPARQLPRQGR